ncbi:ABC transporter [Rhodocollybia butyracea]|uniref:ABC transporter n=1 Tax=Rhodocollybia butyracea TaxID=206335 RepID=A0A9P5Q6G5_9AGAR|nr:ABC transporter [Rhodocollybia butyracea]
MAATRRQSPDPTLASVHSSTKDGPAEKTLAAAPDESAVVTGKKLAVVFVAILLSVLLIALDQTILSTALPRIASEFDAFTLQGWVSTSFVLTQTVFLLFYGQLQRVFPAKWTLISAILIFETGSLVCGLAQNVNQLIVGRTVSGVGGAGIFVGMMQVMSQATRLEDRARLFAVVGAVFGLSSVIGPLIGGAFTDPYMALVFFHQPPIGGVSLFAVTFLLKAAPPLGSERTKRSSKDLFHQALQLDYLGVILIAASVTSLVLALQWGGNTKPWNDKAVIISFVFAGVCSILFIGWEIYYGDKALVPTQIFKSRSIYAIVYVPIFYQAVRHKSATDSGINLLPFMLGAVLTVIGSGQVVGKFGYYWPFLVAAPLFLAVGSGLFFTLKTSTTPAQIIGFQILAGIGTGMGMQNGLLAMQAEFKSAPSLLSQATSMASFGQFLGGTLGLGIAEPILASELSKYLLIYAPDAPASIVKDSPTAIYTEISPSLIPGVVQAYTHSLRTVFVIGVPVAGIGLLASLFIKNIRIGKGAH